MFSILVWVGLQRYIPVSNVLSWIKISTYYAHHSMYCIKRKNKIKCKTTFDQQLPIQESLQKYLLMDGDSYSRMLRIQSLVTRKTWKQPKCLSVGEGWSKLRNKHNRIVICSHSRASRGKNVPATLWQKQVLKQDLWSCVCKSTATKNPFLFVCVLLKSQKVTSKCEQQFPPGSGIGKCHWELLLLPAYPSCVMELFCNWHSLLLQLKKKNP